MTSLTHMNRGDSAVIRALQGHQELRFRLQEMGFTPGAQVKLVARAAFGGPLAFALRGTTVALRKSDADCIFM